MRRWRDVGEGDIKIFLAHIITMGLVQKVCLDKYWDHREIVKTAFFGTYMGRNTFQTILPNFQVSDTTLDLPRNDRRYDPLFKVWPFIDMIERSFVRTYKCGRDLSFDEGSMAWKGRVLFKCYNPAKPAKWHLKSFEVSDAKTGDLMGFEVYTGQATTQCAANVEVLDPDCNQTTSIVMGLMQKTRLLDKGHHVYMDNYLIESMPL